LVSAREVHSVYSDARSLGIDAAAVEAMSDAELTMRLYPKTAAACCRPAPDCARLHLELRRRAVTLALLHVEYLAEQPEGLRYSAFCERYREWLKRQSPVMRQVHIAGDKLFVDYSGMKARLVDPLTGEVTEVELFVAVLGASNYTYAEATRTQRVSDFVASIARALTFIGGVPCAIVPDQLKSAVIKACRYDPAVQRTTAELGRHYNTTILPARPMSPRDKAKVEVGVQVAERWLLAGIRNETFASLGELNRRLAELTEIINTRTMRAYKASRRELGELPQRDKAPRRLRRRALNLFRAEGGSFHCASVNGCGLGLHRYVPRIVVLEDAAESRFCVLLVELEDVLAGG
jgi:transposase